MAGYAARVHCPHAVVLCLTPAATNRINPMNLILQVSAYFARVEEMKAAKADRAAAKNATNNMGENKDIRREVTRPPMG